MLTEVWKSENYNAHDFCEGDWSYEFLREKKREK